MSPVGPSATSRANLVMSASLIGRLGSSAFRPSTTSVSVSLAGSCFSSESAPRPFSNRPFGVKRFQTIHHLSVSVARGLVLLFGIGTKALPSWDSKTRWNNLPGGLAVSLTGVQADMRTHLIHRPARDIIPPLGGARVFFRAALPSV